MGLFSVSSDAPYIHVQGRFKKPCQMLFWFSSLKSVSRYNLYKRVYHAVGSLPRLLLRVYDEICNYSTSREFSCHLNSDPICPSEWASVKDLSCITGGLCYPSERGYSKAKRREIRFARLIEPGKKECLSCKMLSRAN